MVKDPTSMAWGVDVQLDEVGLILRHRMAWRRRPWKKIARLCSKVELLEGRHRGLAVLSGTDF